MELDFKTMHKQRKALLITAAIGVIASFLPWVQMPIVGSVSGTQGGDGWLNVLLFAGSAYGITKGMHAMMVEKQQHLLILVPVGIAGALGLWKIIDFYQTMGNLSSEFGGAMMKSASVGIGLWLVVIAAIVMFLLTLKYEVIEKKIEQKLEKKNMGAKK